MSKSLRYSLHAETVMRGRKLALSWVEGRVLRVVCVEASDEIRIISAFVDRGARKPA